MGTIVVERKTNGQSRYRAEVRKEGQRITKRFPNRSLAKRWITKTESEVAEATFEPELKKHTLSEALERYYTEVLSKKRANTKLAHQGQLKWFQARIGGMKLHKIDSLVLAKLQNELQAEEVQKTPSSMPYKRSDSTVNRYFVPLTHCFGIAKRKWKWLRDVPTIEKLEEPKGRTRFLTPAEARQILAELERDGRKDVYLACKISLSYGSRLNETCALKWADIDWDNQIIVFRETKNGQLKSLPIPTKLFAELTEWRKASDSATEFMFPATQNSRRGHIYDKTKKGFLRACKHLGIKGVTYHCTRHTVASWATQAGINRKIVAEVLGHQDLRMTDRYSHLDAAHLRPMVDMVEDLLEGENAGKQEFDA